MSLRPLTNFAMFPLKLHLRWDYQKNNALLQSGFALTQTFKSSYLNRTVDLWNSFPFRIPSISCFNSFNVSPSKHLLECFTSRFKVKDIYTWRIMCTKCHEQSNLALNSACHSFFSIFFIWIFILTFLFIIIEVKVQ